MGELGNLLAAARTSKGLSLREVERLTGISNPHLSQIEKGHIEQPAPSLLWTLSDLYGLKYAVLLKLAGHAGTTTSSRRSLAGAALHALEDLSPSEQEEVLSFIQRLAQQRRTSEP